MKTLNAQESAEFLKIDIEIFYKRAKAGVIPAAKEGKRWVTVDVDLVQYIRTKYRHKTDSEGNPWGSIKEKALDFGGTSSISEARKFEQAVARRPKKKRIEIGPSRAQIEARYRKALEPVRKPKEQKTVEPILQVEKKGDEQAER